MWTFKCYLRSGGKNEIREWYESLDKPLRAKISSKMGDLKLMESRFWGNHDAKHAQGNGKGLIQINWKYKSKTEYRILGYFKEGTKDFVICHAFLKKSDSDNEDGYRIAQGRRRQIEQGERNTAEYNFSIEADT